MEEVQRRIDAFHPDFLVIPTAPSYLFWRCPPPELRVPREYFSRLQTDAKKVAIGPHTSATPGPVIKKLDIDIAMRGEPDETLPKLASEPWEIIDGCCFRRDDGAIHFTPSLGVTDM
jgi:hypothetical protein